MLKTFLITFDFSRFCQSGFYFDFFYKKVCEVFIRNVFVYASQFLGEKYMIEVLTKKIFDGLVFNANKIVGLKKLNYSIFFMSTITFFFVWVGFNQLIVCIVIVGYIDILLILTTTIDLMTIVDIKFLVDTNTFTHYINVY